MDTCHHQGQEEHQQHLAVDGLAHLPAAHAHLLQDLEPGPVLITPGNLLIIHDQRRGKQAHQTQQDAQKQQGAVHSHDRIPGIPHGAVGKGQAALLPPGGGLLVQGVTHVLFQLVAHFAADGPVFKAHCNALGIVRGRIAVGPLLLLVQVLQHALVRHHDAVAVGGRRIHAGLNGKQGHRGLHPVGVLLHGDLRPVKAALADVHGAHGHLIGRQIQRLSAQAAVHVLRDISDDAEALEVAGAAVRALAD